MPSALTATRPVTRLTAGRGPAVVDDQIAVEEPLEIRVEGRSVAITMRTPGHDEELALGFLLTEGVIASAADVFEITQCPVTTETTGNIVDVLLRRPDTLDFDRLTRHVFSASSCGLCGKATIESVHQRFAALPPALPAVSAAHLQALPARLAAAQAAFQLTGGLHGAALIHTDGTLGPVREDVGRHNAVDKVLGQALLPTARSGERERPDPRPAALGLLVSGRVSFEIMQKALAARLPLVAGVSAPTSLAVDFAHHSGQTLVGFLRDGRCNLYAGSLADAAASPQP